MFPSIFDSRPLYQLRPEESRSLSAENPTGEKAGGARAEPGPDSSARELGKGWKCRPCITINAGETAVIGDVEGPGVIQQIWMTLTGTWRDSILRIYWDDQEQPSIECPAGDFFAMPWGKDADVFKPLNSLAVCYNPGSAFNCYWPMPFRKRARITMENRGLKANVLFYQINYALTEVPAEAAYFHAQFRRSNPLPEAQPHVILDGVQGPGHYAGTAMGWGVNNNGWWGEGEIKFYLDGDEEYPTICGTGTEDYFCGSYNFDIGKENGGYQEFCTPYAGMHQVIRPDGLYRAQQRFSLYRWHLTDPISFKHDIKVDIQALGWRSEGRYLPLRDDLNSVAYWYQTLPTAPFPPLGDRNALEVV